MPGLPHAKISSPLGWLLFLIVLLSPAGAQVGETAPQPAASEPATTESSSYPRWRSGGQIQFQVDQGSLGAPRAGVPFPSSNGIGVAPAASHIYVRRFRPSIGVELAPDFDLQTEFNIDPATRRVQILDVRFNHDLSQDTYLSLGRYKVPFGWEGLRSSRTTNTIERSDMTAALYPERDVGFSVHHREDRLGSFSLGTFLGQARSNGASNGQLDLIGRFRFRLDDNLHLGVSGHTGTFRPSGREADLPVRRLGTELQYASGPFKVEAEAMWSDGYNTMSRADTRAFGYYVAGLYEVADSLELVLHYDRFDPDREMSFSSRARNEVNARDRKVVGLNYEIDGEVSHRFMLNYEWKSELEGGHARTSGWRARYQISW